MHVQREVCVFRIVCFAVIIFDCSSFIFMDIFITWLNQRVKRARETQKQRVRIISQKKQLQRSLLRSVATTNTRCIHRLYYCRCRKAISLCFKVLPVRPDWPLQWLQLEHLKTGRVESVEEPRSRDKKDCRLLLKQPGLHSRCSMTRPLHSNSNLIKQQ